MRLSALLIDDEVNILRNLELVLPWRELDIEIIGLAKNGVQALELVDQAEPDIIFCDIRMPVMDGITFLERLRQVNEEAEVIMLTGYQDFEYARSVIRYGVSEYILKPINYDELTAVLERLASRIRADRKQRLSEERRLGKAMVLAHEKQLYDILMGYSSTDLSLLLHEGEGSLENVKYMLLLADFDDYSNKCRSSHDKERKLWNFAVHNVLQEALLSEEISYAVLQLREGEWGILIELGETQQSVESEEARGWAAKLQETVAVNVKIHLSIGIHLKPVTIHELPGALSQLQKLIHLTADKNRSILFSEEQVTTEDDLNSLWMPIEELVSALKQNDRDRAHHMLHQLSGQFQNITNRSLTRVEKMGHFIVLHLLREMRQLGAFTEETEREIWRHMEQAYRVKDLLTVIRMIVEESLSASMNKKHADVMMHTAKDYIHRQLSRDIGIDELAEHLGISSSYFSLLFKQYNGCTFVEYVTNERIELAKSLLLITDKSVTEIGRSVGYAERRYFNKVFQKLTGEIPSEYRERRNTQV